MSKSDIDHTKTPILTSNPQPNPIQSEVTEDENDSRKELIPASLTQLKIAVSLTISATLISVFYIVLKSVKLLNNEFLRAFALADYEFVATLTMTALTAIYTVLAILLKDSKGERYFSLAVVHFGLLVSFCLTVFVARLTCYTALPILDTKPS